MKTLYESILSSTKTGITGLVKQWIEEQKNSDASFFRNCSIDRNGRVVIEKDKPLWLVSASIEDIPEWIKFGNIQGPVYITSIAIKQLNRDQLPTAADNIEILDHEYEIKDVEFNVKNRFRFTRRILDIKNITINFQNQDGELDLKSLDYIYLLDEIHTNAHTTVLKNDVGKKIQSTIKKLLDKDKSIQEYCDSVFKNFDKQSIRFIKLTDRKTLEWNRKTNKWYLF